MNKKLYKKTFSRVRPSADTLERILDMSNKKQTMVFKKTLAALLIAALIFCMAGIATNAATDGKVAEKISEVADSASKKFKVFVNGKESENFELVTETDEKGVTYYKANIDLPEGSFTVEGIDEILTDTIDVIVKSSDDDGDYALSRDRYVVIITEGDEAYVPTTSVVG